MNAVRRYFTRENMTSCHQEIEKHLFRETRDTVKTCRCLSHGNYPT